MEKLEPPYISPLVVQLLPNTSDEERLAAQATLDDVISVLYRICDRLVEEEEDDSDRRGKDVSLNISNKEI